MDDPAVRWRPLVLEFARLVVELPCGRQERVDLFRGVEPPPLRRGRREPSAASLRRVAAYEVVLARCFEDRREHDERPVDRRRAEHALTDLCLRVPVDLLDRDAVQSEPREMAEQVIGERPPQVLDRLRSQPLRLAALEPLARELMERRNLARQHSRWRRRVGIFASANAVHRDPQFSLGARLRPLRFAAEPDGGPMTVCGVSQEVRR